MASHSFLGRVTKYADRPRLDPRENRLTEVTAGVLEHVDGFAELFVTTIVTAAGKDLRLAGDGDASDGASAANREKVERWSQRLGRGTLPRVEVRTQVGTSTGRWVDLEVRLGPDTLRRDEDIVLWVEVKHGAGLHGDQLEAYELDAPANGLVVVVAPVQAMPVVPTHIPVVSWQRLANVVRLAARRAAAGTSGRFVLDAYIDYLREEDLMDEAFTPTHALAVEHGDRAYAVLSRLIELADPEVARRWSDREDQHKKHGKVKYEPGWWATYPLQPRGGDNPPATWRQSFFEWGLHSDRGLGDEGRHMTAFAAGASMYPDNPVVVPENEGWVNDLRAAGFAVYKGSYQRVWAYLYPEQLLAETSVEGQARYLTDWVAQTFKKLAEMPPPH